MICRVWHGWTTRENADPYERLLRSEIFQGIAERKMAGYHGIELLRRDGQELTEFVTLMWFDSIEAVRAFAGHDYEVAVVPPAARALLLRFDETSAHYEVRQPRGAAMTTGAAGHTPEGLVRDVSATLGGGYESVVEEIVGLALACDGGPIERTQHIVDDVQQWVHDNFVDTTWPRCPRHQTHPLWFSHGSWRCERDPAVVIPLGHLGTATG